MVDEGNLYNKTKRDNVQAIRIMKSCLRHDEIIKLTFYNEIFRFAEFVLCADEIPPAAILRQWVILSEVEREARRSMRRNLIVVKFRQAQDDPSGDGLILS